MTAKHTTRSITHLRELLFNQLEKLADPSQEIDLERVRAANETSRLIIDTAKTEVQFAAVIRGAVTIPFIEDQVGAAERPYQHHLPAPAPQQAPEPDTRTPEERALAGGPAENHPWRGLGARAVKATH